MNKRLIILLTAVVSIASIFAQDSRQRSNSTIIADALAQLADAPIDKKKIELETKDIKDAGVFNGKVRLHVGVVASFKIMVEVEQA